MIGEKVRASAETRTLEAMTRYRGAPHGETALTALTMDLMFGELDPEPDSSATDWQYKNVLFAQRAETRQHVSPEGLALYRQGLEAFFAANAGFGEWWIDQAVVAALALPELSLLPGDRYEIERALATMPPCSIIWEVARDGDGSETGKVFAMFPANDFVETIWDASRIVDLS